jgi:hypothetical protein
VGVLEQGKISMEHPITFQQYIFKDTYLELNQNILISHHRASGFGPKGEILSHPGTPPSRSIISRLNMGNYHDNSYNNYILIIPHTIVHSELFQVFGVCRL